MSASSLTIRNCSDLNRLLNSRSPFQSKIPSSSLTLRNCSVLNQLLKSRSLFQLTPGAEDGPRNNGGRSVDGGCTSGSSADIAPYNTYSGGKKVENKQDKWAIFGTYFDMYYGVNGGRKNDLGCIKDLSKSANRSTTSDSVGTRSYGGDGSGGYGGCDSRSEKEEYWEAGYYVWPIH